MADISRNDQDPKKVRDIISDPAVNTEDGDDWASEGGSTSVGPATDSPAKNGEHGRRAKGR